MNVLELPFNKLIGLKKSDQTDCIFMLDEEQKYQNHLHTVHASALFALAEATSGEFLFTEFNGIDGVIPVVRSVNTRYRKPAYGKVYSQASFADLDKADILDKIKNKQRLLITVFVSLFDIDKNLIMQSDFEWFIAYHS